MITGEKGLLEQKLAYNSMLSELCPVQSETAETRAKDQERKIRDFIREQVGFQMFDTTLRGALLATVEGREPRAESAVHTVRGAGGTGILDSCPFSLLLLLTYALHS